MRSFATERNPSVDLIEQELVGLWAQVDKALRNNKIPQGDVGIPTSKIPEWRLAWVRAFRNMKYHETIYEIVAKQYEAAKLDEAKSASLAQVIDPALVPERKSAPKRWLIVLLAFVAGFFLSSVYIVLQEAYKVLVADPVRREQVTLLKSSLWSRR